MSVHFEDVKETFSSFTYFVHSRILSESEEYEKFISTEPWLSTDYSLSLASGITPARFTSIPRLVFTFGFTPASLLVYFPSKKNILVVLKFKSPPISELQSNASDSSSSSPPLSKKHIKSRNTKKLTLAKKITPKVARKVKRVRPY